MEFAAVSVQVSWVAGMSGEVENSQAVRDAERAAADLLRALNAGAPLGDVNQLETVKAKADERVAVLRRRVEPPQRQHRKHQRRRAAVARRAEPNEQNRPT